MDQHESPAKKEQSQFPGAVEKQVRIINLQTTTCHSSQFFACPVCVGPGGVGVVGVEAGVVVVVGTSVGIKSMLTQYL